MKLSIETVNQLHTQCLRISICTHIGCPSGQLLTNLSWMRSIGRQHNTNVRHGQACSSKTCSEAVRGDRGLQFPGDEA